MAQHYQPRTLLNNWAAQQGLTVMYHDEVSGPQNSPTWISRVYVSGQEYGAGSGGNRNSAREIAASQAWAVITRRCWFYVKIGVPAFILQNRKPNSHMTELARAAPQELRLISRWRTSAVRANNCLYLFAILGFDTSIEV
ncbi:hypothetical protein BDP27DRAFT_1359229 [Rhodocollybia butyracea]|uniref:DRBM domain-containing protein n=1 Tax=Rhodocollybia butyracea TaxID=206335 RepID=A0A9P5Q620_9AGAR|nr:hypothetical protein BDP27DRAFT_1359229 [Rhodocollybia butyracea]